MYIIMSHQFLIRRVLDFALSLILLYFDKKLEVEEEFTTSI